MSRILLADDSPHAQRMGERILAGEGYEVVTLSDGDSTLVRLEDVDPDLVIADIVMPSRGGYDICQYVKISPRHRHTRVLLTAGIQDVIDEAEIKRVKADGFIRKPFEASVLLETVKPLIQDAEKDRPAESRSASSARGSRPAPNLPIVALIDPEQVRAAVTLALDASMDKLIDEITEKVLLALSTKPETNPRPPAPGPRPPNAHARQ
jgi:CheY-like chemotaxis protein